MKSSPTCNAYYRKKQESFKLIPQGPVACESYLDGIGALRAYHHPSGSHKVTMYPHLVHILSKIQEI